jgi:predicted transcriptional regulator
MDNIGVGNGTLSHHLHMLEKMEMIKSRREGLRYRAFYITGAKFPEKEKYRLTELQNSILDLIKNKEGITQKEIASTLNQKQQTISYNIKMMQRSGIIDLKKEGRKTYCYSKNKENSN